MSLMDSLTTSVNHHTKTRTVVTKRRVTNGIRADPGQAPEPYEGSYKNVCDEGVASPTEEIVIFHIE